MNSPVIVRKSLLASSSSRVESSWSLVGECNSSDLPWRISCSSPRSGRSRVKVDVLRRCSHPKILTVPSATGNVKFPLHGVNTSFALSLLAWTPDASICSNSSMSATVMSPFQMLPAYKTEECSWQDFEPNWCRLDWSFGELGWYLTIAPNGITGPLNGIPNSLSYGVFPSERRSWVFRQSHSMESFHHSLPRPDCNSTGDVPSFTLRTALSAIPFVCDLCGVDVQWFKDHSSQDLPNSKELSV